MFLPLRYFKNCPLFFLVICVSLSVFYDGRPMQQAGEDYAACLISLPVSWTSISCGVQYAVRAVWFSCPALDRGLCGRKLRYRIGRAALRSIRPHQR